MTYITLGISAFYHDSAACITENGKIIAAAQEERFTRKKHDQSFPENAIRFCLEYAGIRPDFLNAIAFYDKPWLKFERIIETSYGVAPAGSLAFAKHMPDWLRKKLFMKSHLRKEIKKATGVSVKNVEVYFTTHHQSHAASAFYPSPFEEAAILTADGTGEWATSSIAYGKGKEITALKEMHFPDSLGLLYSTFTAFLGFRVNSGEYKLMGLAPYGNPQSGDYKAFTARIREELLDIFPDGSIRINPAYFNYTSGHHMFSAKLWNNLWGFPARKTSEKIEQKHCDLALAIQHITEDILLKMAVHAKESTGSKYLCMAGGVALNCVANEKIRNSGLFNDIFIQPAAGDAGGSTGAALATYYLENPESQRTVQPQAMQGALLGPSIKQDALRQLQYKYQANYKCIKEEGELLGTCCSLLENGKVVAWVQGRMEFGPRALGNRSILADARNPEMQKKLNLLVKKRESFRPFAPSVLPEDAEKLFENGGPSPFMLFTDHLKKEHRKESSNNTKDLMQRLSEIRSDIPAVTHLDYSARLQTVHKNTNPRYYNLLKTFKDRNGLGVLVNTSFNERGEPIVCNAEDAYRSFMRTGIDYLIIENYIFDKKQQALSEDDFAQKFKKD